MIHWKLDRSWVNEYGLPCGVYSLRTNEACINDVLAAVWVCNGSVFLTTVYKSKWTAGYRTMFELNGRTFDEAAHYIETLLRIEGKL